jgi:hypothetical protein
VVPHRSAGGDQQLTLLCVVPFGDNDGCPDGSPTGQHNAELRQGAPLQWWTTSLTRSAFWDWLAQVGIKPQPGNHTDVATDGSEQLHR